MTPIHELLNRIRWDAGFVQDRFELSYYDRVGDRLVRVLIARVQLTPGDHFAFQVTAPGG